MIKGFDISHFNHPFPWERLSPDFKFCYVKATQGATYKDPYFNEYWQHLKETVNYAAPFVPLLRGAYIFWDCRYTAQEHWDNIAALGIDFSKPGVLPLVVDLENQMSPDLDRFVLHNIKQCVASINELLALIKQHTGRAMVYTYSNYLKEYLNGYAPDCYLWLADYDGSQPKQHFDFWQYSEHGTLAGNATGGQLDVDYFNGAIEDLNKLANL